MADDESPLSFFVGNEEMYHHGIHRLSQAVKSRLEKDEDAWKAGIIVNTMACFGTRKEDFQTLLSVITQFNIDVILVMDNDRLFNDLSSQFGSTLVVRKVSKSGGVEPKSKELRQNMINKKIHHYFYGTDRSLTPERKELKFAAASVFRSRQKMSASMLPKGAQAPSSLRLVKANIQDMHNAIVCISYGSDPETLLDYNVAGFILV